MSQAGARRLLPVWALPVVVALAGTAPALPGAAILAAGPGVGVNLAQIQIEERLLPGGVYDLPTLAVTNTGDAPGNYRMLVTYVDRQPQARPPEGWFSFEPREFSLRPAQTQMVRVRLAPHSGATPGEYFALLEADALPESGGVAVGVAAATKLTFSLRAASWLEDLRLRLSRFVDENRSISYAALGIAGSAALVALLRRLPVRIRFERR